MNKSYFFKQIAVAMCCAATISFSSKSLEYSGGSAGSLGTLALLSAPNTTLKTLKDSKQSAENPAIVKTQGRPRRLAFYGDGKFVTVLNETLLAGAEKKPIQVFSVDPCTGKFAIEKDIPAFEAPKGVFYLSRDNYFIIHQNDKFVSLHAASGKDRDKSLLRKENRQRFNSVAVCSSKDLIATSDSASDLVALYRFDFEKQSLIPLANSPFKAEGAVEKIIFSPSGNFIAIAGYENKTFLYILDSVKGLLMPIKRGAIDTPYCSHVSFSPNDAFCFVAESHSDQERVRVFTLNGGRDLQEQPLCLAHGMIAAIAVSPDSRFVARVLENEELAVHAVDSTTRSLELVQDSEVTEIGPSCIVYSPLGDIAAVANEVSQSISIYEVDRATGKFTPLTGGLLQSELARRAMAMARDVLIDHGPLVHEIIARYLGALYDSAPATAAAAIEEITEADLAIVKTQEESEPKKIQETRVQLFEAISKARFDDIAPLLTPFTINARDEENRTALMHAVRHSDTDSIVEQLLKYKGEKQYSLHSEEAVEVDLNAVDYDGDTALIYAIKNNRFKAAGMLTQKMNKDVIAKANKKGETALSLAQEEKVRARYAGDEYYETLVKLINQ